MKNKIVNNKKADSGNSWWLVGSIIIVALIVSIILTIVYRSSDSLDQDLVRRCPGVCVEMSSCPNIAIMSSRGYPNAVCSDGLGKAPKDYVCCMDSGVISSNPARTVDESDESSGDDSSNG